MKNIQNMKYKLYNTKNLLFFLKIFFKNYQALELDEISDTGFNLH